jgi:hypothetical protein
MKHPLNDPQAPMRRLGFTDEDLRANEQGQLTKRQLKSLRHAQRQQRVLITGAILVETIVIVVMTSGQSLNPCDQCPNLNLAVIILAVGAAIFVVHFALEWHKTRLDIQNEDVAVVEGIAHYRRIGPAHGRRSMYRNLYIDKTSFRVLRRKLSAFEYGEMYRVFYARRSKIMLSAMWVKHDR